MTRKQSFLLSAGLGLAALFSQWGCTGATGPMGASAPNTKPICYYCDNFDGDSVVSGWTVQPGNSNGPIDVYLDDNMFNSPGQSLAISCTGGVGYDAQVYRSISIKQNRELFVEFDFNLTSSYNGGQEFFVNLGGSVNNAILGWDYTGVYLVQGTTHVLVYPNVDLSTWHHAKIELSPSTGLSNYWMDGMVLGTGYTTADTVPGSAPSGYLIGVKPTSSLGSYYHLDNLQCYHL
jgi:hypothetical protein